MKKVIIPVVLILLAACNEKKIAASEVPQAVVTAFNTKYPDAAGVKWEQEKKDRKLIYEAEFKFGGKEVEAEFDSTGNFIREE